jgi:CRP-like cAMP-binding protein
VTFTENQTIFNQSELAADLFILVNGKVTISTSDDESAVLFGPNATANKKALAEKEKRVHGYEISREGETLNSLAFFFGIPQMGSASTASAGYAPLWTIATIQYDAFSETLLANRDGL